MRVWPKISGHGCLMRIQKPDSHLPSTLSMTPSIRTMTWWWQLLLQEPCQWISLAVGILPTPPMNSITHRHWLVNWLLTAADWTLLCRCGEAKRDYNQRSWVDKNSSASAKCRYAGHWFVSMDPSPFHHSDVQAVVGRVEGTPVLHIGSDISRHDRPQV